MFRSAWAGTPARMQGIGESLTTVPRLPPFGLVLVNPGAAIATPAVFKARSGAFSEPAYLPAQWDDAASLADWLRGTRNDLESPACTLGNSVINDVLAALRGRSALPARPHEWFRRHLFRPVRHAGHS